MEDLPFPMTRFSRSYGTSMSSLSTAQKAELEMIDKV
jgi:hypothetical protein